MELKDICNELVDVFDGLIYNEISFFYDNQMSAMKSGHPADMLDEIVSQIGFDAMMGKPVEKEKIEEVIERLKELKSCFKIEELSKPIEHLSEYLKEKQNGN